MEVNSLSRDSRLFGLRPPQSGNGRFGFGSETRKTISGARPLIAGRGSNPLSTPSAGEDELNDDGVDRLAATHLAHHRNESGIRRSRFVLSPTHAPTLRRVAFYRRSDDGRDRSVASRTKWFCGDGDPRFASTSRGQWEPDHEPGADVTLAGFTFLPTSRREAPYK